MVSPSFLTPGKLYCQKFISLIYPLFKEIEEGRGRKGGGKDEKKKWTRKRKQIQKRSHISPPRRETAHCSSLVNPYYFSSVTMFME